jgi:hypothetical protein
VTCARMQVLVVLLLLAMGLVYAMVVVAAVT